ncbi:hypothetical protein J3F84DRAFT_381409 [Trichoderma pleuroticola]
MPISRAKSCDQCRVAKARCSLATPCSRCAKRGLECHYSSSRSRTFHPQRWRKEFRTILPVTIDLATAEKNAGDGDPHMDYVTSIKPSDAILPATLSTAADISFPSSATISEDNGFANVAKLVDPGAKTQDLSICHSDTPSLFDTSGTLSLSHAVTPESKNLGSSDNGSTYPYYVDPLSTYNPFNFPYPFVTGLGSASPPVLASIDFSSPELLTEAAFSPNVLRKPYLSTRERSFQQGYLTGKMLLSQMIEYTHRIAEGKILPPFIHPPCFLSQDNECPPDTPHTCLPKTLAICRTLTQMFYSRTLETNGFIWDQIYSHLRQMHAEFRSYDKQSLLHALQAAIIYGLLRSQCTESVGSEDSGWLVLTVEVFARRLYTMSSWAVDIEYIQSSRSGWVFAESMRRYVSYP